MNNKPIVIFGKKSETQKNRIFVSKKDFEVYALDYEITQTAISEIHRIENSQLDDKLILELFQYEDGPSLWWFFYTQLFDKFQKIISFILKFSEFLDKIKPTTVLIQNDFDMLDIIKQICKQKNIKLEYSKIQYKKYEISYKTQLYSRHKLISLLLERKIKNRQKLFFQNKNSIPTISEKIVFGLPQRYRRDIFSHSKGISKRGEYLVSHMIELLDDKSKVVFVDLFSQLKENDSVLKERLKSEIETFPVEVLFSNTNTLKHNEFLKKFDRILEDKNFMKLFSFNGILFWKNIEEIFQKMKTAPYLEYWLKLIDSLWLFLSKNKPKAIFLPYETGPLALAFIITSKKYSVKTIGLQHGIIHDYHPSYSHKVFFEIDKPYGFPIPDHLLLFGDISKNILIKNGYPSDKLITFGNSTFFNLETIKKSLTNKSLFEKFSIDKKKKIILLLLPAISEYYESGSKHNYNTQVIKKLLANFRNKKDYLIVVKPHPRDDITLYEKILKEYKESNAKIIQGNLLELLFISSVVVSTFSNAIMDSFCLKKPVIQVTFSNLEAHLPHDSFEAVLKSSTSNLPEDIEMILDNKEKRNQLIKRADDFIKKCYNIPENNPKNILGKILS